MLAWQGKLELKLGCEARELYWAEGGLGGYTGLVNRGLYRYGERKGLYWAEEGRGLY